MVKVLLGCKVILNDRTKDFKYRIISIVSPSQKEKPENSWNTIKNSYP